MRNRIELEERPIRVGLTDMKTLSDTICQTYYLYTCSYGFIFCETRDLKHHPLRMAIISETDDSGLRGMI